MSLSLEQIIQAAMQQARETMVERWKTGEVTITELVETTGLGRQTVYDRLTKAGVYTPKSTPKGLKEKCQRDHDMEEWGRPIKEGKPWRYCLLCKRKRDSESLARRRKREAEANE